MGGTTLLDLLNMQISTTRTPGGGPPVIVRRRQQGQVTGTRDCPRKNQKELRISNEIISRTIAILRAGFDAGSECGLENPVDAGDDDQPEHFVDREHAPLWLMPEVIAFKRHAGCREVTFPKCAFGSIFRKMTTFLLTPALGHILSDLSNLRCTHTHHEQRAGVERGTRKAPRTQKQPPPICRTSIGPWQVPQYQRSSRRSGSSKRATLPADSGTDHRRRKSYLPPTAPYAHRRRPPTRRRSRRSTPHRTSLRA